MSSKKTSAKTTKQSKAPKAKAATTTAAEPKQARAPRAPKAAKPRDPRLPPVGGKIEKDYKGQHYTVECLEAGFRCGGKEYKSLTALALEITGYPAISGPFFFALPGTQRAPAKKGPTVKDGSAS